MSIVKFLNARLDDDENLLKVLVDGFEDTPKWGQGHPGWGRRYEGHFDRDVPEAMQVRMRREIAAKRALVASTVMRIAEGWGYHDNEHLVERDLGPMAAIYADHPDYEQGWAK